MSIKIERQRIGDWIQTFTGKQFWPLDPSEDEISIYDIAHSLSMQCRFNGHCNRFYSVAEHCVRVSVECPPEDALWGLLHDASEAYLSDIPRPLKRLTEFVKYRESEFFLQSVIYARFGLRGPEPAVVKRMDNVLLATEKRDLMSEPPEEWEDLPVPLPHK